MPTSETPIDQKRAIMQNKPNLPDTQMNVTSFYTKDYENEHLRWAGKTKPIQTQYKANTNPIQTQFPKSQNERNFYFNKGLWKWTPPLSRKNKPNTNPIQSQYKPNTNPIPERPKMNVTSILTKDYENKPPSDPKKTNPIQTQFAEKPKWT